MGARVAALALSARLADVDARVSSKSPEAPHCCSLFLCVRAPPTRACPQSHRSLPIVALSLSLSLSSLSQSSTYRERGSKVGCFLGRIARVRTWGGERKSEKKAQVVCALARASRDYHNYDYAHPAGKKCMQEETRFIEFMGRSASVRGCPYFLGSSHLWARWQRYGGGGGGQNKRTLTKPPLKIFFGKKPLLQFGEQI